MNRLQRLTQMYVLFAFPLWKSVLLYLHGENGLSSNFRSSFWSSAVLAGYVLCTGVQLAAAVTNGRSRTGRTSRVLEPFFFGGIGLLFIWTGLGLPSGTSHFISTVASIAITLVILSLTWRAGRRFQEPAFHCWFVAYALHLIQALASITSQRPQPAPPVWQWVRSHDWIRDQGRWIQQLTSTSDMVSGVLIATGLILLIRRLENRPAASAWSVVQRVVMAIVLLLISMPVSAAFLNSSAALPTALINAIIFGFSLQGYRQLRIPALPLWCCASAVTLVLTVTPLWPTPLRQTGIQVFLPLALISALLQLGGIVMILPVLGVQTGAQPQPKWSLITQIRQAGKGLSLVQRLMIIAGAGGIAVAAVWIGAYNGLERLSPEPRHEGHTLSYYMQHWYAGPYSSQVSAETRAALQSMGTNALPYLVRWLRTPQYSSSSDHSSRVLQAFRILGPVATPAIPDLVQHLRTGGGNYAASALAYIGPNAIPALTNELFRALNITADTEYSIFRKRRTTPAIFIQLNIIDSLALMGTNAQAAIPALLTYLQDDRARFPGHAAMATTLIAPSQSEIIVPVLIQQLEQSAGQPRAQIADALGGFAAEARAAVPALQRAQDAPEPYVQNRIAAALKKIAPEMEGTLEPLFRNLRRPVKLDRLQALWTLKSLGTNAVDALPHLPRVLHDPVPQVRIEAERCLQNIDTWNDEVLSALIDNVSHENPEVRNQAISTLGRFADRSLTAFSALLAAANTPNREVRDQCRSPLLEASRKDPTFLYLHLENTNTVLRYSALGVLYEFREEAPGAIPILVKLLGDPNPEVSTLATNVLQLQSPNTARSLGIQDR